MLVKFTGVNFTNILLATFLDKSFLFAFSLIVVFGFVIFWHMEIGAKAAYRMFAKLTTGMGEIICHLYFFILFLSFYFFFKQNGKADMRHTTLKVRDKYEHETFSPLQKILPYPQGVNFINIKRTNFLYKCMFQQLLLCTCN
jgi:hypothetical protein